MAGSDPKIFNDPNVPRWPSPGLGNVGSYQVSGHPWITGSAVISGEEKRFNFPYVAKHIFVKNRADHTLRVHFASTSSSPGGENIVRNQHFYPLQSSGTLDIDVRCASIFISSAPDQSGSFTIIAEMTTIPADNMFVLTGSGLTD